jgi:hypothetical protein
MEIDGRRRWADAPACYQIRVRGMIDPHWSDWFNGMAITYDADGDTLLIGTLADQAALYGVLQRIRNLGLILLAVAQLPEHAEYAAA